MDINKCKIETLEHISQVSKLISIIIDMLNDKKIKHDASKLETPEVEIFAEFTPKLKASTYGGEEYKAFLKEMGIALEHHYQNNRHHPEYFKNGIRDMNLVDLIEMICDWKAATLRHDNGDIQRSIEINQQRFGYSDELKQILKNTAKLFE